jgi:hypothetical protein
MRTETGTGRRSDLLDRTGEVRHMQIGEGNYARTERAIRALLDEGDEADEGGRSR